MYAFITVLIIICCAMLVLVILIQNPKGGGLGQAFGGMSNQFLGVKRTTDFLEKATWTLVVALVVLSLATYFFVGSPTSQPKKTNPLENVNLSGSNAPELPTTSPDSTGLGQ